MSRNAVKTFRAVLEPDHTSLKWVIVRLPFDVKSAWSQMVRLRVKGEIAPPKTAETKAVGLDGGPEPFAFRTSLFPAADGRGHVLLVNKKMQATARVSVGMEAVFRLEPDLDERPATVPPELKPLLAQDKHLLRWYGTLSEATRREIAKWIASVKSTEARERRAEQMAERLMLTMEGERVLPPILNVAFRKQPAARKGWQAMTAAQRRGHLLAVFYYRSPESQNKRVQKTVEDALRVLGRDREDRGNR